MLLCLCHRVGCYELLLSISEKHRVHEREASEAKLVRRLGDLGLTEHALHKLLQWREYILDRKSKRGRVLDVRLQAAQNDFKS